ncbi:hypothetical protein DE146DRAFT_670703 [Phaeosphaeria sp. MPI-PUGE-AT-0046c]|nr:hypothetical protein DE146DRAFT_670703 [Phaeosphaeria sp. MPI-PUGE-AT-0046c]
MCGIQTPLQYLYLAHQSSYDFFSSIFPGTLNMTIPEPDTMSSTLATKHEVAKQWLHRRLRRQPFAQPIEKPAISQGAPAQRPRTAPTSAVATVLTMPQFPIDIQPRLHNASVQPPHRPPRPDSGAMRNVDAWLDTSITTPSPPLMSGLPYWRKAIAENAKDGEGMQHATPIVRNHTIDWPSTSQGGLAKSFRRRGKRVEVQMPVSARDKNGGCRSRKQVNRRSNSVPVLSMSSDLTRQRITPITFVRPSVRLVPSRAASRVETGMSGHEPFPEQTQVQDSWSNNRGSGLESSTERHRQAVIGPSARSVDSTRPSTAVARTTREDSVGDISDVPSYFSGVPPPSYHSRPASILTTSSFGCIDGMNPAQRQISQQRAAAQRGMRGKLKRLAQSFNSSI